MAQSVANINASLNLESASFVSGAEKARRAMQQSMAGIQADVSKSQVALAGLTGAVQGFGSGLVKAAVGYASFRTLSAIVTRAATEFAEAESAQVKFASVLKATGGTAGVTAAEITKLADALEATGTVTAEAVTDAAAKLAVFKNVSGDTFKTALVLAQDLSVGIGQDLSSSIAQLGKAFEDPVDGLTALRRAGVSFSETQQKLIQGFVDTGDRAGAAQVILKELQSLVGGAADAQANTLTGSFNAANAELGNFLEALFAVSGAAETSKGALQGLIGMLHQGTQALNEGGVGQLLFGKLATGSTQGDQLSALQKKLADVNAQITQHKAGAGGATFLFELEDQAKTTTEQITRLTKEIEGLERAEHARANARTAVAETVERSLFSPASTVEEERAVNLTKQAFERAAEAAKRSAETTTSIISSAADDRVEIESQTNAELANLNEQRLADFTASLQSDQDELKKHLTDRQRAYADAYQNIADENEKALEDEQKVRDRDADKLADIYAQPFKDLATNFSRTLSSGIQDALSGEFDFATFADGFSDIFADTLAASITAALTPALTNAAQSFGDYLTSALKSSTAAGGAPPGPGLTAGGAALGGAAFGGIAGGLYGAYAPGMKPGNYAGVGGALGGGIGATAGFAIGGPAGALVGAGLGSLAGAGIGGLFGGQNNLGNDRSAQAYRTGRGITYSDTSFSPENRNITAGILSEIETLEEAFLGLGGVIGDIKLRVEAGTKSGITFNGKKYDTAEEALAAAISELIGGTTGLSATQNTILANTKGGTAQEIGADLAFGETYDQLVFSGREVDRVLQDLNKTFALASRQAAELGLNVDLLAQAHAAAAAEVARQYEAERAALGLQIRSIGTGPQEQGALALDALNQQIQELAVASNELGLPIEDLAAAHQRAAAQIVQDSQLIQRQMAAQRASVQLQIRSLGAGPGEQGVLALEALNLQIQELAVQAHELGLPIEELAAAHQRAAAQIVRDSQIILQQVASRQSSIYIELASLAGDNSLATQLFGLHERIKELAKAAAEAGVPIGAVANAHVMAAALMRKALEQQQRGIYDQIAAAAGDTSLDTQLRALETQMRALADAAADVGIPISQVTAAHVKAADELRRAFAEQQRVFSQNQRGAYSQIAATQGDNSVNAQLYELETRMRDLAKAATDLNIPMVLVQKAYAKAAELIWEEYAARQNNVYSQIAAARGDTSLNTQLWNLGNQMKDLAKAAAEVGIPLAQVTDAHNKAAAAIREEFEARKRALNAQVDDLGQFGKPLDRALGALRSQVEQLARELIAAGLPIDRLAEAHRRAADQIREDWEQTLRDMRRQQRDATQGILEAQRSAAGAIDQFLNPFKEALSSRGIGQGVYSGASLTQSGLKEFRETLKEARTGDTGALSSLVGIGQGAISQARQTFGSTAAFAAIFKEIEAGLREQRDVLEEKRDQLLSQIGTFTRETVAEIIRLHVQGIGDLRQDLQKLSRDLIVAVEGRS